MKQVKTNLSALSSLRYTLYFKALTLVGSIVWGSNHSKVFLNYGHDIVEAIQTALKDELG